MHSDISIRSGVFRHFGLRTRASMRSVRVAAGTTSRYIPVCQSFLRQVEPQPAKATNRQVNGGFADRAPVEP
jgi:hypothetical protein